MVLCSCKPKRVKRNFRRSCLHMCMLGHVCSLRSNPVAIHCTASHDSTVWLLSLILCVCVWAWVCGRGVKYSSPYWTERRKSKLPWHRTGERVNYTIYVLCVYKQNTQFTNSTFLKFPAYPKKHLQNRTLSLKIENEPKCTEEILIKFPHRSFP